MLVEQMRVFGPITSRTWPHHAALPRWAAFRDLHGATNDALQQEADSSWWNRYLHRSAAPFQNLNALDLALLSGFLHWCPTSRSSCHEESPLHTRGISPRAASPASSAAASPASSATAPLVAPPPPAPRPCTAQPQARPPLTPLPRAAQPRTAPASSGCPPPPASAAAEKEPTAPQCKCSGNCGSKTCTKAQMLKVRGRPGSGARICTAMPAPGGSYCTRCKCEFRLCQRPRSRCQVRWCAKCGPQVNLARGCYTNPHRDTVEQGPLSFSKLHMELKIVCRLGFVLDRILPADAVAVMSVHKQTVVQPGATVCPVFMTVLFLGQTVKWPASVYHFYALLQGITHGQGPHGHAPVAQKIVEAYVAVIRWSSDREWGQLFEHMNGGLQDAQTGLAVNGQRLGLLASSKKEARGLKGHKSEESIKRRKSEESAASSAQPTVRLGPAQTEYCLSHDHTHACAIVEHMIESAAGLQWPSGSTDFADCVQAWKAWAKSVRTYRHGGHGFDGGHTERHLYKVKSLLRLAILILDEHVPNILPGVQFSTLAEFMPDENEHLTSVTSVMTAHEAQCMFGCHPCLISCYACLAGWATEDGQKAVLAASDGDIMRIVDAFDKQRSECTEGEQSNLFPPGPHIIAQRLVDE